MMEPWEHFAAGVARRLADAPPGEAAEDASRMAACGEAAEALIGWLTGEKGWPWAAARILAGKLVDRAILWTFLDESLDSLRSDLRLIWEVEREPGPGGASWSRLMAPLLGTAAESAPDPVRPAGRASRPPGGDGRRDASRAGDVGAANPQRYGTDTSHPDLGGEPFSTPHRSRLPMSVTYRCAECGHEHPSRVRASSPDRLAQLSSCLGRTLEICPSTRAWVEVPAADLRWTEERIEPAPTA